MRFVVGGRSYCSSNGGRVTDCEVLIRRRNPLLPDSSGLPTSRCWPVAEAECPWLLAAENELRLRNFPIPSPVGGDLLSILFFHDDGDIPVLEHAGCSSLPKEPVASGTRLDRLPEGLDECAISIALAPNDDGSAACFSTG
jgi:hypothetical protein